MNSDRMLLSTSLLIVSLSTSNARSHSAWFSIYFKRLNSRFLFPEFGGMKTYGIMYRTFNYYCSDANDFLVMIFEAITGFFKQ